MTEFQYLKNTQHQKLKAEWTKASANENFSKSESKEFESDGAKIKIIEQIVLCPSKSDANKSEKIHKKNADIKSRKCQICEKSFGSNYEEHIKSKHDLFECPVKDCNKKFQRKSSLRKHSYSHEGRFKYSCVDCNEKFIDKAKFHIHCASRHKKIEKTYECRECQKKFTSPDYLKKHQITHKDEYKYPCTMCEQKFKWLTSLQSHLQIHTQNKTVVQCEHCLKKFFNQRILDRHMRIHQNLKFQCKICNSVTSIRKDNIMRHIRHLHTNISRNEIPSFISTITIKENIKETPGTSKIEEIQNDDDDDDTNELIIDESACVEEQQSVIEVPIVNNRVNVIQCIGNPHKNHQPTATITNSKTDIPVMISVQINEEEPKVTEIIDLNEKKNSTETELKSHQQQSKCDNEIQLPPKKKAIAKYDPIEHYRKILGLPDSKGSSAQKESDEQIFPDHWRKRTSQNFLFRR